MNFSYLHVGTPKRLGVVLLGIVLVGAFGAAAQEIRVDLDPGSMPSHGVLPLGSGIPFKRGQVHNLSVLGMKNAANQGVPAVFEARTRYPDGSIQWAWADFAASRGSHYTVTTTNTKAALPNDMQVTETASNIVVDTGAAIFTWDKSFGSPTRVDVKSASGTLVNVGQGNGLGIYFIDNNNQRVSMAGTNAALQWRVETKNALRTVIRLEGWYVNPAGVQLARAVVRYHLYWNQPSINIDHTFIVTRENTQTFYKEIGITMPLKPNGQGTAHMGTSGSAAAAILGSASEEGWVFQEKYPHHSDLTRRFTVGQTSNPNVATGELAAGWIDVATGLGGATMAVRDFAPQFPKELSAKWDGVTAKLWSGRSGRVLDYKTSTLIEDDWGDDWVRRISAYPGGVVTGSTKIVYTEAQLRSYRQSSVGVARTHELMVTYYSGAYDQARSTSLHAAFQTPPIAYPNPFWSCHVDPSVVTPMAAKGEGGPAYADIERYISGALDEFFASTWDEKSVPQGVWPQAGWIEWGLTPTLLYEKTSAGKTYLSWYRPNHMPAYGMDHHLWMAWIRSGDRRFLNYGRRMNRFLADNKVVHWGGGSSKKVPGMLSGNAGYHHGPIYWWEMPEEMRGPDIFGGAAYEVLFRDTRWLRDVMEMSTAASVSLFQRTGPNLKFAGTWQPDLTLGMMLSLYRVTHNTQLATDIHTFFDALTDISAPLGLRPAFFNGSGTKVGYKRMSTLKFILDYYDTFNRPIARDIALKFNDVSLAQHYEEYYFPPTGYQNITAGLLARVHVLKSNPLYMERINWNVTELRRIFSEFEKIPLANRGTAHFKSVATLKPERRFDYGFSKIPPTICGFRNSQCGCSKADPQCRTETPKAGAALRYGIDQNGVPFYSMPIALWALQGFPNTATPPPPGPISGKRKPAFPSGLRVR